MVGRGMATLVAAVSFCGALGLAPDASDRPVRGAVAGVVGRVVGGVVTFRGMPPTGEAIDMSADSYCRDRHSSPVTETPVRVGPNGGLADVLIRVTNAPSGAAARQGGGVEVVLDQLGCMYAPAVVAVRVGQTVVIRNSDATLHGVRVSPELNRGFNLGQPFQGIESRRSFETPEMGIPVQCDIHGWMRATIHVIEGDFFALTREDGSFELPALPPGEYVVEAWHRTLGTSTLTVTVVGRGVTPEISFEFSG